MANKLESDEKVAEPTLRVLELYSGIGGMHYALKETGVCHEVVTAVDVNSVANKIYHHNFPATTLLETGIEGVPCRWLSHKAAVIAGCHCLPALICSLEREASECGDFTAAGLATFVQYMYIEFVSTFTMLSDGLSQLSRLSSHLNRHQKTLQETGVDFTVLDPLASFGHPDNTDETTGQHTMVLPEVIEAFTCKQLDKMKIDMILMSPPCQPFTRVGKKLDVNDPRTKSFLHLLDLLPRLNHCPEYLLVENVKGFELSQTREMLVNTLQKCNFIFQEFLLTPLQFGIPNSRLRYYLIAKKKPLEFCFPTSTQILDSLPSFSERWMSHRLKKNRCQHPKGNGGNYSPSHSDAVDQNSKESLYQTSDSQHQSEECTDVNEQTVQPVDLTTSHSKAKIEQSVNTSVDVIPSENAGCQTCDVTPTHVVDGNTHEAELEELLKYGHNMRQVEEEGYQSFDNCQTLSSFLENQSPDYFEQYRLPDKDLKRFIVMDIVHPCLTKTICFTKRYGHFMEGAGSIVQMTRDTKVMQSASEFKDAAVELKNRDKWGEMELDVIRRLQLRYFTPREIANLLCFPKNFSFPDDVSRMQRYRTLGNSLNVHVVSLLIRTLLEGDISI